MPASAFRHPFVFKKRVNVDRYSHPCNSAQRNYPLKKAVRLRLENEKMRRLQIHCEPPFKNCVMSKVVANDSSAGSGIIPAPPDPFLPDRQFTSHSFFAILAKPPGPSRNHLGSIFIFYQRFFGVIATSIVRAVFRSIAFWDHKSFPDIPEQSRLKAKASG